MSAKTARNRISVDSRTVGGAPRRGEVLEVLGDPDRPRYRVRWEDGHESIVSPTSGVSVSLPRRKASPRPKKGARAARPATRKPPAPSGPLAEPGDRLVIRSHRIGERQRDAEILQALGPGGGPPFRVRWEDTGAESVFYPGSDAFVEHLHGPRPRRQAKARPR